MSTAFRRAFALTLPSLLVIALTAAPALAQGAGGPARGTKAARAKGKAPSKQKANRRSMRRPAPGGDKKYSPSQKREARQALLGRHRAAAQEGRQHKKNQKKLGRRIMRSLLVGVTAIGLSLGSALMMNHINGVDSELSKQPSPPTVTAPERPGSGGGTGFRPSAKRAGADVEARGGAAGLFGR